MSEKFFSGNENKESEARAWLLSLEKTGKYVFHGSNENVEGELEPRQAINKGKKHGEPAISATQYAEIAIFRAVVNSKNFPEGYETKFGISKRNEKEAPEYNVSDTIFEAMQTSDAKGYVYVLKKEDFEPFSDSKWEVRAGEKSKPVHVVEVSIQDLPKNIYPLDRKVLSPELSFSGKELDFKFKNLNLNAENPRSSELKVTFQKEPMEFKVGNSYGPMEEVLFDGNVTEIMDKLSEKASKLKSLPEEERLLPLLDLIRDNIKYPLQSDIDKLKSEGAEHAQWIEDNFRKSSMPQHIPLSEIFEKGYGICSHLSVAYLWLAQKAGLQGTFGEGRPFNVSRVDNQEPLFKNFSLGEPVSHMWVEIKLSDKQWVTVDPSTKLIGDTAENRKTFKNAKYVGWIAKEIELLKSIGEQKASLGHNPFSGFPAGQAQYVENIYVQLVPTLVPGEGLKVPKDKVFLGTVDFKLKINSPKVTNFKIINVVE